MADAASLAAWWQSGGSVVSLAVEPWREVLRQRWWRQQLAGSVAGVVAVGIALAAQRLRSWPRLAMAAPAAEARRQHGGGGQLVSGGGCLARVRHWRWWQSGGVLFFERFGN
jgi:hypothetical protein